VYLSNKKLLSLAFDMRHYRTSKRFGIITGMDSLDKLKTFLNRVAFDTNLGTSHVSVYLALCYLWLSGQSEECLFISRRKVMALAKIKSSSTYHRVINDLKDLGYIQYYPSYHPLRGSTIRLIPPTTPCRG